MKWTVSQTARIIETDAAHVKKWAVLFKDFLSAGANPPKGQPRVFSDPDLRVFAEVSKHWEPNPDVESIRADLGWLDEDDEEFRHLLYANTPILQEPPDELDEPWRHGFILNGAGVDQYLQLARVYRQSAETLLETALRDGEPHEWGYPVFFAYRHALELHLKIIGEIDEPTHSLGRCVRLVEKQHGKKLNPQIKSWIQELDDIDPKGTAFRYADDEDGTLTYAEHWVDLHQFKFAMSKTFEMIDSAILRLGVTGRQARKVKVKPKKRRERA